MKKFEALVIGGGHAGVEATFVLANKKHHVALITLGKNKIASMPCNPSIGGAAKGIITREIDALGGMQGFFSDQAMIQIKMINNAKGPAIKALRAQIDKDKYSEIVIQKMEQNPFITIIENIVDDLVIENQKVVGVVLENKEQILGQKTIITTGTYMDSSILIGNTSKKSGPDGQKTSSKISFSLKKNGIELQRLKTGTPPRVATDSIDFSQVEKEVLDKVDLNFSTRSNKKLGKQVSCYLTYTNQKTHQIVLDNLDKSSMYSGLVVGKGPRYCPSIEDKIIRFQDKERHQVFYEPETSQGDTIYVNGLSTSMPIEVQKQMLQTLPGMKNAKVLKWGYAIEYDAINPLQIFASLESKILENLYFAGQVNGTSGYEEAAGQGLIAGINAANALENQKPLILTRDKSYIGVLIDDLTTKGTREPYRMLTSRAEYRLLLRNDNADERLTQTGFDIGLVSQEELDFVKSKYKSIENTIFKLKKTYLSANDVLAKKYQVFNGPCLFDLIKRKEVDYHDFVKEPFSYEIWVKAKLDGYIAKQQKEASKMIRMEKLKIPEWVNYNQVQNLAKEALDKLLKVNPKTIGQASRISGINPSDIQMLMFYIEYFKRGK